MTTQMMEQKHIINGPALKEAPHIGFYGDILSRDNTDKTKLFQILDNTSSERPQSTFYIGGLSKNECY